MRRERQVVAKSRITCVLLRISSLNNMLPLKSVKEKGNRDAHLGRWCRRGTVSKRGWNRVGLEKGAHLEWLRSTSCCWASPGLGVRQRRQGLGRKDEFLERYLGVRIDLMWW